MAADILQSLISAASGLGGVWLGGYLTSRRENVKEGKRVRKETTYLAILVGAHLEKFINDCVSVAFDDGTSEGQPAGDGHTFYAATTSLPSFEPLALDIDWKVLPADLMYSVLDIPNRVQRLARQLSDPGYDDPPDYGEYFWDRQYKFASLGLDVATVAKRLRVHADLPSPLDESEEHDRSNQLRTVMARVTKQKSEYASRIVTAQASHQ